MGIADLSTADYSPIGDGDLDISQQTLTLAVGMSGVTITLPDMQKGKYYTLEVAAPSVVYDICDMQQSGIGLQIDRDASPDSEDEYTAKGIAVGEVQHYTFLCTENDTQYLHIGGYLVAADEIAATATITFSSLQLTAPTNLSTISIPYSYRYGFCAKQGEERAVSFAIPRYSGKRQEREQQLNQSVTSAEYWFYDGRLGRRWNVDPVLYPWNGGYTCFNSIPILYADPNGDQPPLNTKSSVTTGSGYNLQVTPAIDGTSAIDLKQDYQIQQKLPTDIEKAMKNNTRQDVIKEGWAGYDDYLITKARVETAYEISKYAPYTGDVHDACSVIYHIGNGNYKGAVKSAVFFIPFADFAKAFKPIFKLNKPITKALANEYEVLAKTHNISDINITDIGTGKFAVIGQSMDRVKASAEFFSKTGSEIKTFHASGPAQEQWYEILNKYKDNVVPDDVIKGTQLYQENVTWINKMKNEGYGFIDIGEDIGAKIKSTFYNMEKGQVYGKSKK